MMQALTVDREDSGTRFDRFLRRHLPHVPLSQVYKLVRTGRARVDGKRVRQDRRLHEGERVEIAIAAAEVREDNERDTSRVAKLAQTAFFRRNLRVVFEDDVVLVCDKPAGLVVHPGSGHTSEDTLFDLVRAYLATKAGSNRQPWLVHRLDRDTSGLLLIAKTRRAVRGLQESLRDGAFDKRYVAISHGVPRPREGVIELDLQRTHARNDGTKVRVSRGGMASRTSYRVRSRAHGLALIDLVLGTGRTHQIRVHLSHIGCPIVGDVRYGDQQRDASLFSTGMVERRLYLHAGALAFPHPESGETIELTLPTPESFECLINRRV